MLIGSIGEECEIDTPLLICKGDSMNLRTLICKAKGEMF